MRKNWTNITLMVSQKLLRDHCSKSRFCADLMLFPWFLGHVKKTSSQHGERMLVHGRGGHDVRCRVQGKHGLAGREDVTRHQKDSFSQ